MDVVKDSHRATFYNVVYIVVSRAGVGQYGVLARNTTNKKKRSTMLNQKGTVKRFKTVLPTDMLATSFLYAALFSKGTFVPWVSKEGKPLHGESQALLVLHPSLSSQEQSQQN